MISGWCVPARAVSAQVPVVTLLRRKSGRSNISRMHTTGTTGKVGNLDKIDKIGRHVTTLATPLLFNN